MTVRSFVTFASVYVVLLSSFSLAAGAAFPSGDVPKAIPDFANGVPGTITSTLTVPTGACSAVTDVNVNLNITHPLVSDLEVSITHNGSGRTVLLFQDSCTSDDNLIALFDDEAAAPVTCPPNGVYRPEFPLSALDGIDAAGTWTLSVKDQANLDTGTLNNWGITLACSGSPQLSLAISGKGSVNSVPGGIACTTGNSGNCAAPFAGGEVVTLTATGVSSPSTNSSFSAWTGGCDSTNGAACTVAMNGDRSVSVAFVDIQPVYIPGGSYYPSLQAAYDAPGASGITIQAQAVDLANPGFTLNSGKSVTLEGGFDSAYTVNSGGYTVLTGVLTIQTGSLTVENLIIR
jgi:subtilisin-like proprotein convertase family protein